MRQAKKLALNSEEKLFPTAVRGVFIGSKIEEKSGFVNLRHIKSQDYVKGFSSTLLKYMEEAMNPFPEFRIGLSTDFILFSNTILLVENDSFEPIKVKFEGSTKLDLPNPPWEMVKLLGP